MLKAHIRIGVHSTSTLFSLQRFSRTCALNKYEANLVTFYLCFDSLAVTGCMHNTSRLWSDLSCCLGYWSHLNDGLYQESCLLPLHLGLCVQRAHTSSLPSIISTKTNQLCCAANKRCLPKQTKWRSLIYTHQNKLYGAPRTSLKGPITSSFPETRGDPVPVLTIHRPLWHVTVGKSQ